MPREDYSDRVKARAARFLAASRKSAAEASARLTKASAIGGMIPMGQPILVGHHSEGRHRADLNRIHENTRKGIAASDRAKSLETRAGSVGSAGISSDDPEASGKLKKELTGLEARRDAMKAINAAHKKGGWEAVAAIPGVDASMVATSKKTLQLQPYHKRPFPDYAITNIGASIRRVKERVESVAKETSRTPDKAIHGDGFHVEERPDINRVAITFKGKPPRETLALLKARGFHWSPTEGAHLRLNNDGGRYAAKSIAEHLGGAVAAQTTPVQQAAATRKITIRGTAPAPSLVAPGRPLAFKTSGGKVLMIPRSGALTPTTAKPSLVQQQGAYKTAGGKAYTADIARKVLGADKRRDALRDAGVKLHAGGAVTIGGKMHHGGLSKEQVDSLGAAREHVQRHLAKRGMESHGAVQTGAKGGRYILLRSGRKFYLKK